MSVFFCKFNKGSKFFLIGCIVDAVRKRDGFLFDPDFRHMPGDRPVGQQHEFFDQLMGILTFLHHDADGFSFFIQFETDFHGRKIDGPFFYSLFSETLGDFMQDGDLFRVRAGVGFNDLLHVFIGKPVIGMDHGSSQPVRLDHPLMGNFKYSGKTEFVLIAVAGNRVHWRSFPAAWDSHGPGGTQMWPVQ